MRRRWFWLLLALILIDGIIVSWWTRWRRESRFDPQILQASARYGVDPALVKAVIWRESNFDARALGSVGEIGLMQVRGLVAKEWTQDQGRGAILKEQLFDPETNIQVGTWYLGKLLKRYQQTDQPAAYALADYNAGRTRVIKWMAGKGKTQSAEFFAQMDYPTTQQYVRSILARRAHYQSGLKRKQTASNGARSTTDKPSTTDERR